MIVRKKPENIVEKGENTVWQHFLPFSQGFLPYQRKITSPFKTKVNMLSANVYNLGKSLFLSRTFVKTFDF